MKKIVPYTCTLAFIFLLVSCFSPRVSSPSRIKITESSRSENFTNDQLRNLIKQNQSPSVVVRNLHSSVSDISSNSNTARISSILEMGLARNGLDVRDRSLFDNVVKSTSSNSTQMIDYQKLYKQTQVDLLMEISSYSVDDLYKVDKYWMGNQSHYFPVEERLINGKKHKYHPTYLFRGMSISIKVIILKDNLIGGTYHYTYVPCSEAEGGALINQLSPLRYTPPSGGRSLDAIMSDDSGSPLVQSRHDRLDQAMENFITNTVAPQMISDMRGQIYQEERTEAMAPVVSTPTPSSTSVGFSAPSTPTASSPSVAASTPVIASTSTADPVVTPDPVAASTAESPEKKPLGYAQVIANLKQGTTQKTSDQEKLRNIVPINSFEKIAPAVSNLINLKITQQENSKKLARFKTDLDRLKELKGDPIRELENFIATSTAMVGLTQPERADSIMLYLSSATQPLRDLSLVLFIDGQCVGVGSTNKGFYSAFPLGQFTAGFHVLTLTTSAGAVRFTSTVDFSLKSQFVFRRRGARIELTN